VSFARANEAVKLRVTNTMAIGEASPHATTAYVCRNGFRARCFVPWEPQQSPFAQSPMRHRPRREAEPLAQQRSRNNSSASSDHPWSGSSRRPNAARQIGWRGLPPGGRGGVVDGPARGSASTTPPRKAYGTEQEPILHRRPGPKVRLCPPSPARTRPVRRQLN
jgi:hypothetical protein